MMIIDFDDTLFDTQSLKQATKRALSDVGVTAEDYDTSYRAARNAENGDMVYTTDRHIAALVDLGYDQATVAAALHAAHSVDLSAYLFPDAHDAVAVFQENDGPLYLLSLGAPAFQEYKINASGIRPLFAACYYMEDTKEHAIRDILSRHNSDDPVWFVNDKIEETEQLARLFPELRPVMRRSVLFPIEQYEASDIPSFDSLSEIAAYVARH